MGLLDALFGVQKRTKVEVVPDHIWMTTDAKFAGLGREAEERSKSATVAILLVAHFLESPHFGWDRTIEDKNIRRCVCLTPSCCP